MRKQSKKQKKECFTTENQEDEKIINKEELEKRNAITGNKTVYFQAYLRSYFTNNIHYTFSYNLTGLAKYIYSRKYFMYTQKTDINS